MSDRSGGSAPLMRGARRLLVGERRHELVGRAAGALEHLALVVRAVGHLLGRGDGFDLLLGVADAG